MPLLKPLRGAKSLWLFWWEQGREEGGAPSVPLEITLPAFLAVSVGAGAHSPGLSVLLLLPDPLSRYNPSGDVPDLSPKACSGTRTFLIR